MTKKSGLGTFLTGIVMGAAAVFFSKKENRDKTTKLAKKTATQAQREAKKISSQAKRKGKKIIKQYKTDSKKNKQIIKAKK